MEDDWKVEQTMKRVERREDFGKMKEHKWKLGVKMG